MVESGTASRVAARSAENKPLLGRSAVPGGFVQAGPHKLDQVRRSQWLHSEDHIQIAVFNLCLRQPAQHNHWKPLVFRANGANQRRAAASRHDVVSNHHADPFTQSAQCGKRAVGGGGNGNLEPSIPQHCLADTELHGIVIDEQNLAQYIHGFPFTRQLCTPFLERESKQPASIRDSSSGAQETGIPCWIGADNVQQANIS